MRFENAEMTLEITWAVQKSYTPAFVFRFTLILMAPNQNGIFVRARGHANSSHKLESAKR